MFCILRFLEISYFPGIALPRSQVSCLPEIGHCGFQECAFRILEIAFSVDCISGIAFYCDCMFPEIAILRSSRFLRSQISEDCLFADRNFLILHGRGLASYGDCIPGYCNALGLNFQVLQFDIASSGDCIFQRLQFSEFAISVNAFSDTNN